MWYEQVNVQYAVQKRRYEKWISKVGERNSKKLRIDPHYKEENTDEVP